MAGKILLWGDTQTGKSSLLAAALVGQQSALETMIDYVATGQAITQQLSRTWALLKSGEFVPATGEVKNLELQRRGGGTVTIQDIRGGIVGDYSGTGEVAALRPDAGDAVLFLLDVTAPDLARQMLAIGAHWPNFAACPHKGLVLTKCELQLHADHEGWQAAQGWWRTLPQLASANAELQRFASLVWPTSVFGFAPATDKPSFVIGEFGEIRPFNVTPKGVEKPFLWALDVVGRP